MMSKYSPAEYTIFIKLKQLDGERLYEGRVMELPDVSVYEDTYSAAYDALISIIESLMEMDAERGVDFPEPFNTDHEYSGRVTLRMPKSLHRQLDFMAITEECSINQLIVQAITNHISTRVAANQTVEQVVNRLPSLLAGSSFFVAAQAGAIWDSRSGVRAEHRVVKADNAILDTVCTFASTSTAISLLQTGL